MPATPSTPVQASGRPARTPAAPSTPEASPAPRRQTPEVAPRPEHGADWITAAVVFAILGGCVALWLADLSLVSGAVAAMISGVIGILFAEV